MPAKNDAHKTTEALTALLHAAETLIAARDDAMLTDAEWDALRAAVQAGRKVVPPIPTEPDEMLATMRLEWTSRTNAGAGTWAAGTIAGHTFQALVFPEHAECESYELGRSRISKLHLREHGTGNQVACFDRGWDVIPINDAARTIVDLLAAGLAETVYGK